MTNVRNRRGCGLRRQKPGPSGPGVVTATGKGCGSLHAVADAVYIQSYWYESPHGCTGGDMWHLGEGGWICPSCGHENRLYETPEIEKLKPLFKKTENSYKR